MWIIDIPLGRFNGKQASKPLWRSSEPDRLYGLRGALLPVPLTSCLSRLMLRLMLCPA